jgi:triacylglycerol lipase
VKQEIRRKLAGLGRELTPEMMSGGNAIFAALQASKPAFSGEIVRDLQYGPHARNRLDVFKPKGGAKNAPVLIFVHGGGFVMGDKTQPGSPFYDNIGRWAAENGMIGVTMTYRLAPADPWPGGAQDVGRAVAFLREEIAAHGGDPARIFLSGQSAGAVHVASYVAFPELHVGGVLGIAGAIMLSGLYDIAKADRNQFNLAYYGEDSSTYAARSSLPGLLKADVPMLFTVSEFDGADFQRQAAQLNAEYLAAKGELPRMLFMTGHNHITPVLQIGTSEDTLGAELLMFVEDAA